MLVLGLGVKMLSWDVQSLGESDAGRAAARETDSAGCRAGEMLRKSCRLGFFLEKTFSSSLFFLFPIHHVLMASVGRVDHLVR